jgi:hypothetical protein
VPVILAIVGLIVGAAALQVGQEAGRALWLPVVLAALAFVGGGGGLALVLWHRRRMGEIHELYAVEIGRWRRVSRFAPWPKACRDCGQPAHDWKSTRAHDDEETSPCMVHLLAREAADRAPLDDDEPQYSATMIGHGGHGDGATDTMLSGPDGAPELDGGADG